MFTKLHNIHCTLVFAILTSIGFFLPSMVYGGGLHIYEDTLTINGRENHLLFSSREKLKIRYFAQDYSYSGHKGEYGYHVFLLSPKINLSNSVGNNGNNRKKDVKKVQEALSRVGLFKEETTGVVTSELIDAIYRFQKSIGLTNPDGRIDSNGRTLRLLQRSKNHNNYFVVPARLFETERHSFSFNNNREPAFSGNFIAPKFPGEYDILYSRVTLFSNHPFSGERLKGYELSEIANHFNEWESRMGAGNAASFKIKSSKEALGQDISVYVRVNNKLPYKANIEPGLHEQPIIFSWYTKPQLPKPNTSFQYRLYPGQDWSEFYQTTKAQYFFLSEGQHEFQVRGKYTDVTGETRITPVARVSFALRDAFVSQPTKGTGGFITEEPISSIDASELYKDSYALVIGITKFVDSQLSPLPFTAHDAQIMSEALIKHGFNVQMLVGAKTKKEITEVLGNFLAQLKPDSRVIIYFSTHGIQHPIVKSRAYLAGTDCRLSRPDDTCIPLSYIEDRLLVPLALPVKHTAVILDACATGLGVFLKSSDYKETQIASENGAHMMTAGMADQLAQGDTKEAVSFFTKYLVEGLKGEADYTGDEIITLSELLVYTRYKVAQSTNGTQTPMMGRILAPGEMIFDMNYMRKTDDN